MILEEKKLRKEELSLLLTDTYQSQAGQAKKFGVNSLFSRLANSASLDYEEKVMVEKMHTCCWQRSQKLFHWKINNQIAK